MQIVLFVIGFVFPFGKPFACTLKRNKTANRVP
jgi:hypothetical protein